MSNWINAQITFKGKKSDLKKVFDYLLPVKSINDNYLLTEKVYLGENTIIDDSNITIKNNSTNTFWVSCRWGVDYQYLEALSKKFNITIVVTSLDEENYTVEIKNGVWINEYESVPRALSGKKIKKPSKGKLFVCPEKMF